MNAPLALLEVVDASDHGGGDTDEDEGGHGAARALLLPGLVGSEELAALGGVLGLEHRGLDDGVDLDPGVLDLGGPLGAESVAEGLEEGGADGVVVDGLAAVAGVADAELLEGGDEHVGLGEVLDGGVDHGDEALALVGHVGALEEGLGELGVSGEEVSVEELGDGVGVAVHHGPGALHVLNNLGVNHLEVSE
eukprot:20053_1